MSFEAGAKCLQNLVNYNKDFKGQDDKDLLPLTII